MSSRCSPVRCRRVEAKGAGIIRARRRVGSGGFVLSMRPVSRGSRGKEVLDIQTRLRGLGLEVGREGADGHFGPQTELAVRAFQQARLVLADGVVGENTWAELVEAGYQLGERLVYVRIPPMRGGDVGRSALEGVKIALEPGHGGTDPGHLGVEGLVEKKINLDLARTMADMLNARGAEVLLVRESDSHMGFSERAEATNRWGTEINLALHHNANSSARAHGAATYYFANGTYFSEAGKRLAGYIVKELVEGLGRTDLHTHGRNFSCLREPDGLSVMVEPGFMTHPGEGAALRRSETIEAEAEAILRGLERYLSRS